MNGKPVGEHRGGYDPFTVDVTDALRASGDQEIVVRVWDPTDKGPQPRGKQVLNPRTIWYTAVTGIWQTVWLETVPSTYLVSLRLDPDVDAGALRVTVDAFGDGAAGATARVDALDGTRVVGSATGRVGETIAVSVPNAKLWSPADPFLYDLSVQLSTGDAVKSYVGMRKIAVGRDDRGVNRLLLNGKVLFQYGQLDQGWWPDGLYTAPTDAALRFDIETQKQMGFNTIRKHVKVEPARWYYDCDRLGMLVWQDMPSGDNNTPDGVADFGGELERVIAALRNHPSIVMWVPFNEGWGQHETEKYVARVKALDPSRLVNNTSGWTDRGVGDIVDGHAYPGPAGAGSGERSRGGHRRVRRSRPADGWPYLARERELGLSQLHDACSPRYGVPRPHDAAEAADRQRRGGGHLHADDRRRDRSQRPDDLRSGSDEVVAGRARGLARGALQGAANADDRAEHGDGHGRRLGLHDDRAARRLDADGLRRFAVVERASRLRTCRYEMGPRRIRMDDERSVVATDVRSVHGPSGAPAPQDFSR